VGIYALIQISGVTAITAAVYVFSITIVKRTGKQFHLRAINTVMGAPMSLFTMTAPGVILNRFSQDLTVMDGELAQALSNASSTLVLGLGQAAVVATSSPYIIAGYPLLVIGLYWLQKFYLRTSRQLRFLDLETKSPLL
jgi:ATP-binding cassette subfamily C (CFTR/MRP) protein 1